MPNPNFKTEGSGVYSNLEIAQDVISGNIVIEPYNPQYINGSSYDVTLGAQYYRVRPPRGAIVCSATREAGRLVRTTLYNPYDAASVQQHFTGPYIASAHEEFCDRHDLPLLPGIPLDQPVIVLGPGERILGHTHEFIGIRHGTASMQARSTTGRNGVSCCYDAGWGDPGYINRWTMEIYNNDPEHSLVLAVGSRVAQMVFNHIGPLESEYALLSGKYQTTTADDISRVIAAWRPEHMLPKAYLDELKPLPGIRGLADGVL
jgi:dCTP deaminase